MCTSPVCPQLTEWREAERHMEGPLGDSDRLALGSHRFRQLSMDDLLEAIMAHPELYPEDDQEDFPEPFPAP